MLFKALLETVPEFRSETRVFSPRSFVLSLYGQYAFGSQIGYPCRGGVDFFFVGVKRAKVHPCGFRGAEKLGGFCDLEWKKANGQVPCYRSEWECFRDPSEMFGPILYGLSHHWHFLKKLARDRPYFQI
jgi:hypothetical protein